MQIFQTRDDQKWLPKTSLSLCKSCLIQTLLLILTVVRVLQALITGHLHTTSTCFCLIYERCNFNIGAKKKQAGINFFKIKKSLFYRKWAFNELLSLVSPRRPTTCTST